MSGSATELCISFVLSVKYSLSQRSQHIQQIMIEACQVKKMHHFPIISNCSVQYGRVCFVYQSIKVFVTSSSQPPCKCCSSQPSERNCTRVRTYILVCSVYTSECVAIFCLSRRRQQIISGYYKSKRPDGWRIPQTDRCCRLQLFLGRADSRDNQLVPILPQPVNPHPPIHHHRALSRLLQPRNHNILV